MSDITPFQQQIYNTWLRVVRTRSKRPFRPRQQWDNLDPSVFINLTKLSAFFAKHNHIDIECFFSAPYEVYVHDIRSSYTLEFFTTHKAVSLYTSYLKILRMLPPDHPTMLTWIKRSFIFIGKYCITNNTTLENYGSSLAGSFVSPFLQHIKDGYITLYAMFVFPTALQTLRSLDPDIRQLMLGDIDIHQFAREFAQSRKAKPLAISSFESLEKYLKIRKSNPVENAVEMHK